MNVHALIYMKYNLLHFTCAFSVARFNLVCLAMWWQAQLSPNKNTFLNVGGSLNSFLPEWSCYIFFFWCGKLEMPFQFVLELKVKKPLTVIFGCGLMRMKWYRITDTQIIHNFFSTEYILIFSLETSYTASWINNIDFLEKCLKSPYQNLFWHGELKI